jgi:phosphonate transport system substrate-binding protein
MSNGSDFANSPAQPPHKSVFGSVMRVVLFLCVLGAILYAADAARRTMQARDSAKLTEDSTVQSTGLISPAPKVLTARFTDHQGRLLADPPDAGQVRNPDTIVIAHIVDSDPENPTVNWPQLEKHIAEVTGKKVVDQEFDNSADQLAEIGSGKITLAALHAADAPFLVNNYGFQPVAVLADSSGVSGNHLDIIVPASSSIERPADLRGHTLVCTVPASITGYRAAVALLMQTESLRPNVDYFVTWSLGQKRSIEGVTQKQYEAAAVSDDKVQSLLSNGDIDKANFKTIYQSEVIPRTTIGWFYDLNPQLAATIGSAILSYQPTGATTKPSGTSGEEAAPQPMMHFVPIEYKKDFQLVRLIDASFDPRLDAKTKNKSGAAETP